MLNENVPEKQMLEWVREIAAYKGWLFYHTYDSRRSTAGFPDVVLAKNGNVLFLELKTEKGRVRPEQYLWLDHLPNAMIVRPHMLDQLPDILDKEESKNAAQHPERN